MANSYSDNEHRPWECCHYCTLQYFKTPADFERHLRDRHCSVEGDSLVCRYGYNGVCAALALDHAGSTLQSDYESHIRKRHVLCRPPQPWDVYSAAQNLPAALNDPNRSKATAFFTSTWGDGFVEHAPISASPHLPEVTAAHFEQYVKRVCKKYKKHARLAAQCALDSGDLARTRTHTHSPSAQHHLTDIPLIFFESSFPLNSKETFSNVFPGLETTSDRRSSCRGVQERLSHYLDIVEVQIAKQVAQKSEAFFHAMLSHDTIMEQMSLAISVVTSLRRNIHRAKQGLAASPLTLIRLATCRHNTNTLYEKLKLMSTVHQTQPMIQLLLSTGDYVTALDLIASTQAILSTQLSGVHAFRHLSSQLAEMERLIDKMLTTEFRRFVGEDFNRAWSHHHDNQMLDEDKLISVVSGLLRRRKYEFVDICKEECIATVQATMKQVMIEEVAAHGGEGEVWVRGEGEAGGCKAATLSVAVLTRTTSRLTLLLQRLLALKHLVLRAAVAPDVALADGEEFFTCQDQTTVEGKLDQLVNSVCDYCLERCSSLISGSERDKTSPVDGEEVVHLAGVVDTFSQACDQLTGRPCLILRNSLKNRFSRYVLQFHNEKMNKLTLLLDNERWKKSQVPAEFQAMVDHIVETGRFPKSHPAAADREVAPHSCLMIDGEPYSVVGVVLLAMGMVAEYCHLSDDSLVCDSTTAVGKSLNDLLKTFNSRTCTRVLGAGALQTAGLKTITVTNLALAWRCLQVLLWLLKPIRSSFSSMEVQWSALERDITSHIGQIRLKLCNIAGDALGQQLKSWEARPPVPSQQLRSISKHLLKLHEALLPALPSHLLSALFQTVHDDFKDKLREQLSHMNIVANGGPQHGVVTSELTFYLQTLATLQVLPPQNLTLASMNEIWSK